MGRSVKKGPFTDTHLEAKLAVLSTTSEKKVVRTWSRRSTILPEFVGHTDRKSTRLNSSHLGISYAVFCLKKHKIILLCLRLGIVGSVWNSNVRDGVTT